MIFLARYYLANLVLAKVGGQINLLNLRNEGPKWERLRASVAGHDKWLVVGNGPSLRVEDLEALSGIPSVASNRISLLFDRTSWRPTLYTVTDPLLLFKFPKEHFKDFPLTLTSHAVARMARTESRLMWRLLWNEAGEEMYLKGDREITPLNGFIEGASVTCPNIQLAMWAGAKTVYVIGCDHFYAKEEHKDGVKKTAFQGASNHFDPNYRKPGEIVNSAPVDAMNRGYELVRKVADRHGVRIVNISRKTALEAFELGTVEGALADIRNEVELT